MSTTMRRVNELLSGSVSDYVANYKTWGSVMLNVLNNGLIGDGVIDDTGALQALINSAIAAGRKAIYFPHTESGGAYRVTALANADQVVFFGDNASFTGGYTGVIGQFGDYGDFVTKDSIFINVKDHGAKGDGVTDDTTAITTALTTAKNNGMKLFFPPGTYLVDQIIYGTVPFVNQISIEGADRDTAILKKKTADGNPLFVIGSAAGTNFTSNITISNMTFQGITGNTPAAFRAYDLVRSKFENCRFTGANTGLDMLGGIANNIENCLCDFNQIGWKLDKFTSFAGGGWPNLNTAYSTLFLDNTSWGVYFDGGRLLNLENCEIEGNGTTSVSTTGGLFVGSDVGSEVSLLDIGVNITGAWFEANLGDGAVQFNSGRNSIYKSYFVANTGTYDIHINAGRYNIQFCDGDTVKTNNVLEEATVTNGNYIFDCDFANLSYDNAKTMIFFSGNRFLMRDGEVPVMTGVTTPLVQQGLDSTAAGVVTVTFPVSFAVAPNIQVTMNNDSAGTLDVPEVYAVSTTQFTCRKKSITSGSATVSTTNAGFYWRAIGQK